MVLAPRAAGDLAGSSNSSGEIPRNDAYAYADAGR